MKTVLITGSSGLVGSACVRLFASRDYSVVGVDNNMRREFFGENGDTLRTLHSLQMDVPEFTSHFADIRDAALLKAIVKQTAPSAIIHCAGQPSHDWAAQDPMTDFSVNALGTLNLLEAARESCPEAPFIFMSTNKVYGDRPNQSMWVEGEKRYHCIIGYDGSAGFSETLPIDATTHSVFGASKVAADIMVQEYGRYFGMPTTCLRAGCITGGAHAGAEQHGFLSYLVKCCVEGKLYHIYGYKGKQVRDNIHASDLAQAIYQIILNPKVGEVYNIGGEHDNSISILEAFDLAADVTGSWMAYDYVDKPRQGDHRWYVTDMTKFRRDYPAWQPQYTLPAIFEDIARGLQ